MRSFTIRTLMVFVVVAAVGIAGLRNASGIWAGCLLLVTVGLLLTSMLRAIYTAGSARAGWDSHSSASPIWRLSSLQSSRVART